MKNITIKDIARLAGVSCATVSRALNGGPGVSEEVREKIFRLCQEHGYRKNLIASRLSASRSGLIGCILSDLNNPLFSDFALTLEQAAHRAGFQVMFCQSRVESPDFPRTLELLMSHRVDGVILVSSSVRIPEVLGPYMGKIPIIVQGVLSVGAAAMGLPSVCVDCSAAGRKAARHLYELGHKRVVFLGMRQGNVGLVQRCRSFRETAESLGMTVRVLENTEHVSNVDVGYRLGRALLYDDFQETAVFAASDNVALGFLAAAKEFCVSVPEEVSLIGFDNISSAAMHNVRLTTFDPQNQILVERSLDRLLSSIATDTAPAGGAEYITPDLIQRATCIPPHP